MIDPQLTSPLLKAVDVRQGLVDLLRRDLIGPHPDFDTDLEREILDEKPSRWYVSGFIVPAFDGQSGAPDADDAVETETDDMLASEALDSSRESQDEQDAPDQPPRDRFLPSSLGLTVMLPESVKTIDLRVTWGDYRTEPPLPETLFIAEALKEGEKKPEQPRNLHWVRISQEARVPLDVTRNHSDKFLTGSSAAQRPGGGLQVQVHQRLFDQAKLDGGSERVRIVTVFLVNRRKRATAPYTDISYAFQVRMQLDCALGFYARKDLSTYHSGDFDLRLGDLHYRDVCEYAVGRNTSGGWEEKDGKVTCVWSDPLPAEDVEKVVPNTRIAGVKFGMDELSHIGRQGPAAISEALDALPRLYGEWLTTTQKLDGLAEHRADLGKTLIDNITKAKARIEGGIALLKRDDVIGAQAREAFAVMNESMAMAAFQREVYSLRNAPEKVKPTWRPFQLAFVLLNLAGLSDRDNPEREIVDLLFFPTGGGKTEAYLGLAAYTIALRRSRGSGVLGAGVSVIMRYTLRLLTLDQLGRAAGLVCALEIIRTRDEAGRKLLGDWPIEIGLWVGGGASPNRLRPKNTSDTNAATTWLNRYKKKPKFEKSPVPLKACPWCYTPFTPDSFRMTPNALTARNLAIKCENAECVFTRDKDLPILVVDEPIYRRLPAFLIATVDKFAALPWVGQSGAFFGHVDRFDPDNGFYGAAEPGQGRLLGNGNSLDPPDLIIQDELHLISGPLGTVAGLYETAIDLLSTRNGRNGPVRPKIVASTATVRRAEKQIRALFDRQETAIFPPSGISRKDSFFAQTIDTSKEPGRRYLGIASQGRGPKLLFLRVLQTVLSGAMTFSRAPGDGREDPADAYLTVLAYFNALRELGGARRIVEDEIREHVANYGHKRQRISPAGTVFVDRQLQQPIELTSRVTTDQVAVAKERLGKALIKADGEIDSDSIDVALATNMISVGLDITRLGLMVMQGQPKTSAEYIQATSRVGRAGDKPGLVITLLNLHKPRDRTHYEQFRSFHASFYRSVEATSVTPFAPRALDRALAALVVAAARHIDPEMTPSNAVTRLSEFPYIADRVVAAVKARAISAGVDEATVERAVGRTQRLIQLWIRVAHAQSEMGVQFTYDEGGVDRRLLQYPLDAESEQLSEDHQSFSAARSLRDVEYTVLLKTTDPNGKQVVE